MKRNLVLALGLTFLFSLAAHQECMADSEPWQAVNGPYGGSVAALVMSPGYASDHTVFAGLRGQGVYRTNDSGNSWQRVSPSGWVVTALAISPAFTTDRTLATVGLPTTGMQVYHSTDAGQSWQAPTTTPYPNGFPNALGLAISPNFLADHTVYVLGGSQTYTSTDGGLTFVQAGAWFASHQVLSLAFSPAFATDRTLFTLVQNEGLAKSSDGGATWGLTGLSGALSTFAVSSDYAHDQMLAATRLSTGQVLTSTDGGSSWLTSTLTLGVGGPHIVLFSPTFSSDRIILAARSTDPGAYRSIDGGGTWSPAGWYSPTQPYYGGFMGGSVLALALAPHTSSDATALAGTSSGLYRSSNWGEYWYQRNNGLARLTVRSIALAPSDPATLLAGTSFFEHLHVDAAPVELEGNLQLSTDGGQQWQDVSGRLDRVRSVAFSPGFPPTRSPLPCTGALGQHGFAEGGVYRSTNGGHDWMAVFGSRVCEALAVSPGSRPITLCGPQWPAILPVWACMSTTTAATTGPHWRPLCADRSLRRRLTMPWIRHSLWGPVIAEFGSAAIVAHTGLSYCPSL